MGAPQTFLNEQCIHKPKSELSENIIQDKIAIKYVRGCITTARVGGDVKWTLELAFFHYCR